MSIRPINRRNFLTGATAACLAGAGAAARAQETDPLQELIQRNQQEESGAGFDAAANSARMPTASLPTLSPATTQTTEAAVAQYEQIVARGGWPQIPAVNRLRLGMKHASVPPLRERLVAAGDLDARIGSGEVYDTYVEAAVRRFQTRHGLGADGIVREQTLRALNVPAEARLNQLRTNVVRLRAFSGTLGSRFVMANIPAAWIEAVENGVAVSRHTAVAGKPDRPSPDIQSKIVEINFNPFWTVPVSIVRKDLIPKMQAEPDYLTKYRIRIFDQRGSELPPAQINWFSEEAVNYRFKQDPGGLNSLGTMRINFPSAHGVYMHDTPFKNLFGEDDRFHSSGCMRVQNVRDLVYWLLAETPGWSRQEIDQVIKSGERKDARVAKPVPLYWVYVTAWATPDNVVQFREDIYNRDGLGQYASSRG
ncbi:MAG TPA: L,D-transpeptidase family protein [Xanthobacteraceae bacterium]|nr:L,D-transpeptidase family protein [Xanthobacteraceae bacterium]